MFFTIIIIATAIKNLKNDRDGIKDDRTRHIFKYEIKLNTEILPMIILLHEYKGQQDLLIDANKDELKTLIDIEMIQNVGASNRI